jgi:quercetin dioxygenase-like cupin family protein
MRTIQIVTMAAVLVASGAAMHPSRAQQPGLNRIDLQRHDLSASGREVVQVRVELAPGVRFPKHTHPGEEIIYVLEGSLEYQIGDNVPVTVNAGGVLFVPAGAAHSATNGGNVTGAELATYIVEKGKPLLSLIQ